MTTTQKTVLLTGGTGFIGQELGLALVRRGYHVRLLGRDPERHAGKLPFPAELVPWDQGTLSFPYEALDGCLAVVNLAGEPIAEGRWSTEKKERIRSSRVEMTAALVHRVLHYPAKPRVFVQASAIGYYGERGDEILTESSTGGDGFLHEVCRDWEQAAQPIVDAGIRTVFPRIGMVLGATGGALPQLAALYAKGLGGKVGGGRQWVSWIHVDDLVAFIIRAIEDERLAGVYNAVAPEPCRYTELHAALNVALGTSGSLPTPGLGVKLALGEKATIVLGSQRVVPQRALAHGFAFRFGTVGPAVEHCYEGTVARGVQRLIARQWVPAAPEAVWAFFSSEKNLEHITPPFLRFTVKGLSTAKIEAGTRIKYTLKVHGVPVTWESLIRDWTPPSAFVDTQEKGPYAVWHHRHTFEPLAGGVLITDVVQYKLPLGLLGGLVAGGFVDSDVKAIFAYRRKVIATIFDPAKPRPPRAALHGGASFDDGANAAANLQT